MKQSIRLVNVLSALVLSLVSSYAIADGQSGSVIINGTDPVKPAIAHKGRFWMLENVFVQAPFGPTFLARLRLDDQIPIEHTCALMVDRYLQSGVFGSKSVSQLTLDGGSVVFGKQDPRSYVTEVSFKGGIRCSTDLQGESASQLNDGLGVFGPRYHLAGSFRYGSYMKNYSGAKIEIRLPRAKTDLLKICDESMKIVAQYVSADVRARYLSSLASFSGDLFLEKTTKAGEYNDFSQSKLESITCFLSAGRSSN